MAARDGPCSAAQLNPSAMHTSLLRKLRRPAASGTLLIALGALLASCGGDGSVTDPSKSNPFVSETPQPAGHRIVFALDLWEHAYMDDYGVKGRDDYSEAALQATALACLDARIDRATR